MPAPAATPPLPAEASPRVNGASALSNLKKDLYISPAMSSVPSSASSVASGSFSQKNNSALAVVAVSDTHAPLASPLGSDLSKTKLVHQ